MNEAGRRERATRYALQCPLRFRTFGAIDWYDGRLRNMSESGLLFVDHARLADRADLEITIDWPPPGIGSVWCAAVVVRREAETASVGARISEYRLQPRSQAARE